MHKTICPGKVSLGAQAINTFYSREDEQLSRVDDNESYTKSEPPVIYSIVEDLVTATSGPYSNQYSVCRPVSVKSLVTRQYDHIESNIDIGHDIQSSLETDYSRIQLRNGNAKIQMLISSYNRLKMT